MSKINDLKQQNPDFGMNLLEVLHSMFPVKYLEMILKIISNKINDDVKQNGWISDLSEDLNKNWKIDKSKLSEYNHIQIFNLFRILDGHFTRDEFYALKKFVDLNERKLISDNDLRSYKSFEKLLMEVASAEIKLLDKSLAKCIKNLFENDEWIIVKPLTWLSSKKYGANTKWCTASEYEANYFINYTRDGILIYILNKKTGIKHAAYKKLGEFPEISFWNMKDHRIDSMQTNLPDFILDVVKSDFNTNVKNFDLLSAEEKIEELNHMPNNVIVPIDHPEPLPFDRPVEMDRQLVWELNNFNTNTTNV